MNTQSLQDLQTALSGNKVSFFLMIPMNELQKYLRNGLLYISNVATQHYDQLVPLRYKTEEVVLMLELAI